ncbi:hypothetical protein LTR36_002037 [Oleoguttula mirabilis]|uniref:Uncharacterized protein n=1 Tax=Oleoguttula mirabilis TaxID=1507867 RepID=A0AAV9JLY5_9PEZI|nr:hypothetical protein LTR36_002037 [Oleoguttula mirabilis]
MFGELHGQLENIREARRLLQYKSAKALPRKPQPRTSQLRGSLLRYEVKPSDIVELTDDFESLPDWFALSDKAFCLGAAADLESELLRQLQSHGGCSPEFEKRLGAWSVAFDMMLGYQPRKLEPRSSAPPEERKPQPRTSELRGSLLRNEVKISDIVDLTDDYEELPAWFLES